jgi:hypothetical protein
VNIRIVTAIAVAVLMLPSELRAAESCAPVSAAEIDKQWNHYSSLAGVQPNGGSSQYECIAIDSTKQLVCRTKPENPAHPSIVIRTVVKGVDGVHLRTEADTAGDCSAFLKMMEQYKGLDGKIRNNLSK